MALNKPFKLIWRSNIAGKRYVGLYTDGMYSDKRFFYLNSFYLLEKDLKEILEYVYPSHNNSTTYSHRIYEVFLRACTEFETNAKAILKANWYSKAGNWNIEDYFKINRATKLSDYEVKINVWDGAPIVFKPFKEWSGTTTYMPLTWYKDYNEVKHDRHHNFEKANFLNLINAVSAVLVILYAQYGVQTMNQYQEVWSFYDGDDGFGSNPNNLFSIKPAHWGDVDKYDFDWEVLKQNPNPFDQFMF